jgi:uncharacterized protein YdhG (YjbR/CyaY superfamily)
MATKKFASVDQYVASFPKETQATLQKVRSAIARAIPKASQAISYNIGAFQREGANVIYFAGWKSHFSIYPANKDLIARFEAELAPYEVNDKGTIRFPLVDPPLGLIGLLAKFRWSQVEAEQAAKPSKKKATKKKAAKKKATKKKATKKRR